MGSNPAIPDPAVQATIGTILDQVMLPYQREAILCDARFCWFNWSRQVGKSFGMTFRRIVRGMARGRDQFFLSAGDFQSGELIAKAREHLKILKIGFEQSEQDLTPFDGEKLTQRVLSLPGFGMRIIGRPANPDTARGLTGDVFLDEFGMHRKSEEIWGAMYPSVTRDGGEIDVASTPKGKQNKFYELAGNDAYARQTVTIVDAVRQGLVVDIEELRAGLGDEMLWRQEFMCEFVDEATAFLTLDMIRACEDEKLPRELDLEALADHKGDVVVGMDIGRHHDLTVIWALDAVRKQLVSLGLIELHATPFREQFEICCRILECRCVRKFCVDATGLGMQMAEMLEERFGNHRVEGHTFTANLKSEMAGKLRVKMEETSVQIPADKRIRDDLHSIEKSVTVDGKIRLRTTRQAGSHADRFWAIALAVYGAADDVGPVECELAPAHWVDGARTW